MVEIEVCYAYIGLGNPRPIAPMSLRGYLGYLFIEDTEFHHHSESSYHYPLVQYKRVNKRLLVMGLQDYAEMVYRKMPDVAQVATPEGQIPIVSLELVRDRFIIAQTNEGTEPFRRYRFATPWIALNNANYLKFHESKRGRKEMLQKILVGNILSMLKGLGVYLEFQVKLNVDSYETVKVTAHDNQFVGFRAVFETNISLPQYLGLGKSVSKGFGAIST